MAGALIRIKVRPAQAVIIGSFMSPLETSMVEMPADFSPLDPGRINSADPFEIEYWSRKLQCSPEQLEEVVARVGEHVNVVREALTRQPGS